MKGYKRFIWVFSVLLVIYIVAEMNRPKPINWEMTLSATDKNPFGAYILYRQLHDIFPKASINKYSLPVYDQLNQYGGSNSAYLLIDPQLRLTQEDMNALLDYVVGGNYVFIASADFGKILTDSLKFSIKKRFDLLNKDSVTINFNNPLLHTTKNYGFQRATLDGYLDKFDTANTIVLGSNQLHDANFIKMPYGEGAFFIHALPVCFSNYFMLTRSNAEYTAKALSYLPRDIDMVYWDEYYKTGVEGSRNPLRYILNNNWLRAAFRIGLLTMILFLFFEGKRRQRIIPVIEPLRNSTLDFVQTVSSVYFNQHDNKNIALKMIGYFLESVRSGFFLSTSNLNDEFIQALAKKASVREEKIKALVVLIQKIHQGNMVSDQELLELNRQIDELNAGFK